VLLGCIQPRTIVSEIVCVGADDDLVEIKTSGQRSRKVKQLHQPKKVYIDTATWDTLPKAEIRSGLAETVKHACLGDHAFFQYLEENIDLLLPSSTIHAAPDPTVAAHIAAKNCEIKARVVAEDVNETNFRQVLNLGHTLGRALEALAAFSLSHGECVAIGLMFQLRLGSRFGYVTVDEVARVERLLARIGLPTRIPGAIPADLLIEKMHTDKKARRHAIRFVFQDSIGSMVRFPNGEWSRTLAEDDLATTLAQSYG
jgi:3-dehydroquinate synthase